MRRRTGQNAKHINLALQGGGAHGAYTWGVLERLMGDRRLHIAGLSGTSAGAMNAVVMADGFIKDRREGAIRSIREFWERISRTGFFNASTSAFWKGHGSTVNLDQTPLYAMFDMWTRLFSPYELNPLDYNPLIEIIEELIDFEELRKHTELKLFVTATNVRTGKPRVFTTHEMTAKVLMASACLPLVFKAVEIDGEHYWDGGYLGNPAIYPLIYRRGSKDVVIVQVTAIRRDELPASAADVLHRITEISFNSSLMREMRAVAFATRLIDNGELDGTKHSRMLIHWIGNDPLMSQLGTATQFHPEWSLLCHLRDEGRESAGRWLEQHFDHIGVRSTVDVDHMFL